MNRRSPEEAIQTPAGNDKHKDKKKNVSSGIFGRFFIGPNAVRTLRARLFAWAGRVRYAWRPAATRTVVRKAVAAARQPMRIDGAMSSISQ
jgi:hypothetical protein